MVRILQVEKYRYALDKGSFQGLDKFPVRAVILIVMAKKGACERMKPEHQGGKEGVIQVKKKICSE
jgi:hypothetical protein